MPLGVFAVLAVALPFLFAVTAPPSPNFWPLVFAWGCGGVLAVGALVRGAQVQTRAQGGRLYRQAALVLAWGLLLAAVVGSVVGLLQYLGQSPGARRGFTPPARGRRWATCASATSRPR
ncbi:hypothetical protein [Acidovorax sp. 1608163]|uniref:hypothetical protein n=1 Tax=Acidovorax sp. 1608163 TaxID=2478662 RepID=UPI001F09E192|nr:hypothetical protein [Acidovorax sp. 1608163]